MLYSTVLWTFAVMQDPVQQLFPEKPEDGTGRGEASP